MISYIYIYGLLEYMNYRRHKCTTSHEPRDPENTPYSKYQYTQYDGAGVSPTGTQYKYWSTRYNYWYNIVCCYLLLVIQLIGLVVMLSSIVEPVVRIARRKFS